MNYKINELHRCPICGSIPLLEAHDMGYGNGHGYPGCTAYTLKCPYCGKIEVGVNDIYNKAPQKLLVEKWNTECEKLETFLEWRNK